MDQTNTTVGLSPLKQAYLALQQAQGRLAALERARSEPLALIGIGCRMPGGAGDPESFWRLLDAGQEAIGEVPADRWDVDQYYDPDPDAPGKMVTRRGGFVDGVDRFDASFFGISPREAQSLDPQQRLLLETAVEALEDAGLPLDRLANSQGGVFVGICGTDYAKILARRDFRDVDAYLTTGQTHSTASGRISYFLGLHGPAAAVDTACSSSLVALHLACQSLRSGECDFALAGATNMLLDPETFINFSKARMLSPDGRCKTFSAEADGYVRGEGCGIVVLKRLSDALAAGDRIRAVIRGSAVNQDGPSSGLTVPNGVAQQAVLRAALAAAHLQAEDVDYLEAHGTGTALGDPIEMGAIGAVFGAARQRPLVVGSVKTNVGHLEAAAGMAGLLKVVLALEHEAIPPHLHFQTPSPHIPWDRLPVRVPTETLPWPRGPRPRRAGISSFGFSGTNAHVIVEEAPPWAATAPAAQRDAHLVVVSAKTPEALEELAGRYAGHLAQHPELSLADVSLTTTTGRASFGQRGAVLARSSEEARSGLDSLARHETGPGVFRGQAGEAGRVAFLFSGQGAQYAGMGRGLYQAYPAFRAVIDRCQALLGSEWERPLTEVLFERDDLLVQTGYTQPALYALECGLAELWKSWGLQPAWLMGHSVGEYAAAYAAGVFSLEDGLRLVAARGRLMQALPPDGAMAAVWAEEAIVADALRGHEQEVSLAAVNGPQQVVLSGQRDAVAAIVERLAARGVRAQALAVSHAFHSPLVEPMQEAFRRVAEGIAYQPPRRALVSNLSGQIESQALCTAEYWCRHVRQPVRFAAGMESLLAAGARTFLEIGPQATLLGLGRACWEAQPRPESARWLPSLHPQRPDEELLLSSLAELYVGGEEIDWPAFHAGWAGRKIALPGYPFQRQRYWVQASRRRPAALASDGAVHPLLGVRWHHAAATDWVQFETTLAADEPAYLQDHRLWETAVLPGTAYLEMALAAARQAWPGTRPALGDVSFEQALPLEDGASRRVQVLLRAEGAGHRWEIFSRAEEHADPAAPHWTRHASGKLVAGGEASGAPSEDLATLRSRCPEEVPLDGFYSGLRAAGLDYGPTFRALRGLWRGDGEALGRVELPESLHAGVERYGIHPALLDACLHAISALGADEGTYVPVGVERVELGSSPGKRLWSHVRLGERGATTRSVDVTVLADDGQPVAVLSGLRLQHVQREALLGHRQEESQDWLYEVAWRQVPALSPAPQSPAGEWLILADSQGLAGQVSAELARRGAGCLLVHRGERFQRLDAQQYELNVHAREDWDRLWDEALSGRSLRGAIDLGGLGVSCQADADPEAAHRDACHPALLLVQTLAARRSEARLWLVTQGTQAVDTGAESNRYTLAQAGLWGLGAVVAVEHPERQCVRLDLDPAVEAARQAAELVHELLGADGEDQVAYRHGQRHVARLARRASQAGPGLKLPPGPYRLAIGEYGSLDALAAVPLRRQRPGAGQVEIEVSAVGLNFRDVLRALGMLAQYEREALGIRSASEAPLGFECVGRIAAVGEGVQQLAPGDEVLAVAMGSLASHVCVPARSAVRKPPSISCEEAATLPVAYVTALYGLEHLAKLQPRERVLVHAAAGGVGQAAVRLALARGAEVFATAHPSKWELLKSQGVRHVMSSRTAEFAQEVLSATGGEGVHVVLNSLSGEMVPASLSALAPGGRFVELGKLGIWSREQVAEVRPDVEYFAFDLGDEERRCPGLLGELLTEIVARVDRGQIPALPHRSFTVQETVEAFRFIQQARHVGKVVVRMAGRGAGPSNAISAEGRYLVTGGLGGLGLAVAQWLVAQGARKLVLTGRHGVPSAEQAAKLDVLKAQGAEVEVVAADVSRREEVQRLLAQIGADGCRLRGIVHAAGVLDDGLLADQDWQRFGRVFGPKAAGAWHLDCLAPKLDFLVLFSSAASVLGSEGQANYAAANAWLDTLAHHRQARGQRALSINWGPWAEVGMAARMDRRQQEAMTARGMGWIGLQAGLDLLGRLLQEGAVQAAVLPIDWDRWAASAPRAAPLWRDLVDASPSSAAPAAGPPPLVLRLREAPADQRRGLLLEHVRAEVAAVLGWSSAAQVGPRQRLFELGMDSLTSVELRHRLEKAAGCSLPVTAAFDYPTPEALAGFLWAGLQLEQSADEPAGPPDANRESSLAAMSDAQVASLVEALTHGAEP